MTNPHINDVQKHGIHAINTAMASYNHVSNVAVVEVYYMILERIRFMHDPAVAAEIDVLLTVIKRLTDRAERMERVGREN